MLWQTREYDLKNVKRYGRMRVMFYRTDLHLHSQRVKALVKSISEEVRNLYPNFNPKKAGLIALHHDDHELITGDVPLQLKLRMNGDDLSDLKEQEILATEAIAKIYPKTVGKHRYLDLTLHAIHKDCLEAQVVSLVDKCDGYCEAIHEVLAGNDVFLEPLINYNIKTFNNLFEAYPLIDRILQADLLKLSATVELWKFFEGGEREAEPHTAETIRRQSGIPVYEWWKKVTIRNFGLDPLVLQTKFPPWTRENANALKVRPFIARKKA